MTTLTNYRAMLKAAGSRFSSEEIDKMSEDDAARVMNYARKEHPELMRQTVEEKPWFVRLLD